MSEPRSFSIPDDVGAYLEDAAAVLRQSSSALVRNLEIFSDDDDPDWMVTLPHGEVERLARNLSSIADFAAWVAKFREGNHD